MSVESILGSAANTAESTKTTNNEQKDMFLKLLVAQLSNQDPLNPAEDKEFIAQLATFTQVEELQKLNEGMTSLVAAYEAEKFTNATNLLGKRVLAAGTSVSKMTVLNDEGEEESATSPVMFLPEVDLASCTVNVHMSGGYTIYSEDLGYCQAGNIQNFVWDGTGPAGMSMPNGVYEISVVAYDNNGNRVMINTEVFGDVQQVERTEDGEYYVHMYDGRSVKLDDVSVAGWVLSSGGTDGTGTGEEETTP